MDSLTYVRNIQSESNRDALEMEDATVLVTADHIIITPTGRSEDPRNRSFVRPRGSASLSMSEVAGQAVSGVFIRSAETVNTGGGIMCDVFLLTGGCVLIISDEAVGIYEEIEHWLDSSRGWCDGAFWDDLKENGGVQC